MALTFHSITPDRFAEARSLCALQFGVKSYQSSERFFTWLYCDHPKAAGRGMLGYDERGQLTAVSHEFLGWAGDQSEFIVAHNLFTYPERTSGVGGALVMRYSRLPMVVPGAVPPLSNAYKAARFTEVPIRSFIRKIASPYFPLFWGRAQFGEGQGLRYSASLLGSLANKHGVAIDWKGDGSQFYFKELEANEALDPAFLRWRHFAANGPLTLVIHDGSARFAFVTIGLRKRLIVARIGDSRIDPMFLNKQIIPILARLGVVILLVNSRKEADWSTFSQAGMQPYNPQLRAFVTRSIGEPRMTLSASFSDLGLEAILTRIE
ncbi:hypothetical protein [Rhizorhabdus wittichii]|uniref:hypothetical protein n=1 Tax=Rhizorhabdus wittichii TaxID=160791 RepID=UPI0012FE3732|nr:hypothetical protein [Rhizorhabdus wittichii]